MAHKEAPVNEDAAVALRAAVITVSDRSAAGERKDAAGPALRELLENAGYEVTSLVVVPDERPRIEAAITDAAASDVALCVTTGGTGLSPRDVTPEATAAVCERMVPGIGEAMRQASAAITPYAWLSRATAGTLGRTLVVNVPGSPRAAVENLSAVLKPVAHGIKTLRAQGPLDCASERTDAPHAASDFASRPCVLFDFDGTLADTKAGIMSVARTVLSELGMTEAEMGDLSRLVGPPFPAAFTQIYGMAPEEATRVGERYSELYAQLGPETHPLFDGIADLLRELKAAGRRLAVTTSKGQGTALRYLTDDGVLELFDAVVGKVDPTQADKAHLVSRSLAELGCTAEDAVMVGDRHYDVEGAHAQGVPCVGVYLGGTAPEGELERAGADAVAHSVAELGRLLMGERA